MIAKGGRVITVGATPAQVVEPLAIAMFPGLAIGGGLALIFDLDLGNAGFLLAIGVVALLTAALFGMRHVRFDDTGISVRRPLGVRRVAWTDVRAFAFVRESGGVESGVPGYELVVEVKDQPPARPGETVRQRRRRRKAAGPGDLVLLHTQSIAGDRSPPVTVVGRYAERQLAIALSALDDHGVRHRVDRSVLEAAGDVPYVRLLWERAGRGDR